jgi:succinyl-diaminopimelate desuccinylase
VFITPTVFQSGSCDQLNVISGKGILGLDVRTIPGVDHAALAVGLAHDADEIAQRHGLQLHVDVIEDRPPAEVSEGSLLVTAVRLAHECVLGRPAIIGGVPGTTDGTILTRDAGIPVVVYGPGGKWIAHQANEYVDVADLLSAAGVYAEAARRFLTA